MYESLLKDFSEWTSDDFEMFYYNLKEIASDADLASKKPILREIALEHLEAKEPMIADYR